MKTSKQNNKTNGRSATAPSRQPKQRVAQAGSSGSRGERGYAAIQSGFPPVGLSDLKSHLQSWVIGQLWVGDGTNGALQSIYFATNTFVAGSVAGLVPGNSGGGMVPVLGSDARLGQTYISDVRKHFSRIRIRKCWLTFVPLKPATDSTAGMLVVAPVRGAASSGDTVVFQGATTAAPTIANTISMAGATSGSTWTPLTLDLTPYISNGTGAAQNEYAVSLDADTTAWGTGAMDMDLTCPCAFVVAGSSAINGGSGGMYSHVVIASQEIDLLDFIGGNTPATPETLIVAALRDAYLAGQLPAALVERFVRTTRSAGRLLGVTAPPGS